MTGRETRHANSKARLLRRHVALPADHGAWALLIAPLAIGLVAGGRWTIVSVYLTVAVLCAFLIRQPITLGVKAYAGRRSRDVLPAVRFWVALYGAIGLLHVIGLVLRGFGHVLWLALPGVPVFLWHLYLVARRDERGQWLVETLAAGALALGAPAAYWVGLGRPAPVGWLLWILCWGQSSSWIAHAYLRLGRRERDRSAADGRPDGMRREWSSLASALLTLVVALGASVAGLLPRWLWVAFTIQCLEALWGTLAPTTQAKPRAIGLRQLLIGSVQTILFIGLWRLGS